MLFNAKLSFVVYFCKMEQNRSITTVLLSTTSILLPILTINNENHRRQQIRPSLQSYNALIKKFEFC